MLERLNEQKSAVNLYTIENPATELPQLLNEEWKLVESIINVFQPIEEATNLLSGDKYCTASLVLPLISSMIVHLKSQKSSDSISNDLRKSRIESIKTRFSYVEKDEMLTFASMLDPRVKDSSFISTENRLAATSNLQRKIRQCFDANLPSVQESQDTSEPSSKKAKLDPLNFAKEQKKALNEDSDEFSQLTNELQSYLKEPLVDEKDIIKWWFENRFRDPNLYKLSQKYLAVPATSCSSERIFSKAGQILNKKVRD